MAKRFTDTDKWRRPWFRALPDKYKLLWLYILDNCEISGIWYEDLDLASFLIGTQIKKEDALSALGKQVEVLGDGSRWFIRDFVGFQYGELRDNNPLHRAVLSHIRKSGLEDSVQVGYSTPMNNNIKGAKLLRVYQRDNYTCGYCEQSFDTDNLEPDHIVPLSAGGTNDLANVLTSCKSCNRAKSSLTLSEFCEKSGLSLEDVSRRIESRGCFAPRSSTPGAKVMVMVKDKVKEKKGVVGGSRKKSDYQLLVEHFAENRGIKLENEAQTTQFFAAHGEAAKNILAQASNDLGIAKLAVTEIAAYADDQVKIGKWEPWKNLKALSKLFIEWKSEYDKEKNGEVRGGNQKA